jgi:Skp family chaperone for outer membrane proteins
LNSARFHDLPRDEWVCEPRRPRNAILKDAILAIALALGSLAMGTSLGSPTAAGQEPTRVAVIDIETIYRKSAAAKALQLEFARQRSSSQDELNAKERKLVEADQELSRQRGAMASTDYSQQSQDLARRMVALQREARERKKSLEGMFEKGTQRIKNVLTEVIGKIATERELDLVITAGTVVLQNPVLDITQETMARLNARLPNVSLTDPSP